MIERPCSRVLHIASSAARSPHEPSQACVRNVYTNRLRPTSAQYAVCQRGGSPCRPCQSGTTGGLGASAIGESAAASGADGPVQRPGLDLFDPVYHPAGGVFSIGRRSVALSYMRENASAALAGRETPRETSAAPNTKAHLVDSGEWTRGGGNPTLRARYTSTSSTSAASCRSVSSSQSRSAHGHVRQFSGSV